MNERWSWCSIISKTIFLVSLQNVVERMQDEKRQVIDKSQKPRNLPCFNQHKTVQYNTFDLNVSAKSFDFLPH